MTRTIPNRRPMMHRPKPDAHLNFRRKRKKFNARLLGKVMLFLAEATAVILAAFLLIQAFGIRTTVTEESMEPTVRVGDQVLLDRLAYKISSPKANDVVAFLPAGNLNAQYSIKRVIAVPGQTVVIRSGTVYVDNKPFVTTADTTTVSHAGLAEEEIKLGKDEYFLLGDDRNSSEDSRYSTIGNVTKGEIEGKVWMNVTMSNFGLVD
ncbi:MAG: signal peptidase I [Lachnospiraceae bacterium]|nr:signal peptidase I [Lachnospiraceae bacterium]